jgi:hypothetical protein
MYKGASKERRERAKQNRSLFFLDKFKQNRIYEWRVRAYKHKSHYYTGKILLAVST